MTKHDDQYSGPKFIIGLGVSFAAGLAGGIVVSNRMNAARRMPHASDWERYMAGHCGHVRANCMINRVESRYWNLFCQRPTVVNPALRQHLNNFILPALALYLVLREEGQEIELALGEVEKMLYTTTTSMRKPLKIIARLPFFYSFVRSMTPNFVHRFFPPNGWDIDWVEKSENSVAFNIHKCFYLETLKEYGVPELTLVFCKLDDRIYEDISPYIRWERTGTLARGDQVCDFRWTRV